MNDEGEAPDADDVPEGPVRMTADRRMRYVAVDQLTRHPRNPRQGDVGAIIESIQANGFFNPLIVQRSTGHVLAGNHRLDAARQLRMPKVPVVYVDVDDEAALRILIADNRTADLATYDDTELVNVLEELARSDLSLAGTGFDGDDLDDLVADLGRGPLVLPGEGAEEEISDEYYTPPWIFEALGLQFDIDVCAPEDRQYVSTPATRFFTKTDNGLVQPWEGLVWCNPPYSEPEPWLDRCIAHGDAMLLVNMFTSGRWLKKLWEGGDAFRIMPRGTIFIRADGSRRAPMAIPVLAAFGSKAVEALRAMTVDDRPMRRQQGDYADEWASLVLSPEKS